MPTVISFSWSRQSSATLPATGQFRMDFRDGVYRAVPWWSALDYAYTADGMLVALVSGPTDDGDYARLRIYQLSGGTTPAVTSEVELETSGVLGGNLSVRADGRMDLFYTRTAELQHRWSGDGGRSWSAAESFVLQVDGVDQPPALPLGNGTDQGAMDAVQQGGWVAVEYDALGQAVLLYHTNLPSGLSQCVARGSLDADGERWTFGAAQRVALAVGAGRNLQRLGSGGILLPPGGQRLAEVRADGTHRLVGTGADFSSYSYYSYGVSGLHERSGLLLGISSLPRNDVPFVDRSSYFQEHFVNCWRLKSNRVDWERTASLIAMSGLSGWRSVLTTTGGSVYSDYWFMGGKVRRRRDRVWEYFTLGRDEQPAIYRCRSLAQLQTGSTTWA